MQQRDLGNAADSHAKILVSPSEMKFLMEFWAISWWDLALSPLTAFPSQGGHRHPAQKRGTSPSGLLQVWVLCLGVIFTVICLTKGLAGVSQLQGEKLHGFPSHSKWELPGNGGALLRFQGLFLSLRKWQSWKLQPTASLPPFNSSLLALLLLFHLPTPSWSPGSCTRSSFPQLRKRAGLLKWQKQLFLQVTTRTWTRQSVQGVPWLVREHVGPRCPSQTAREDSLPCGTGKTAWVCAWNRGIA